MKKIFKFVGFWLWHIFLFVLIPFFILSCFATNLCICVVQAFRWTGWDVGRICDIFVDSLHKGVK